MPMGIMVISISVLMAEQEHVFINDVLVHRLPPELKDNS